MSDTRLSIDGTEICNNFIFSRLRALEIVFHLVSGVHSPLPAGGEKSES
jgi:hypothetical protein